MSKLAKVKSDTRQVLIQAGAELIAQKGFNTAGIEAVLKAAGVPKGSFYYYFPSKDAFGLAVIEHLATEHARKLDDYLGDQDLTPLARIRTYLEAGIEGMACRQCQRGCPIGNLSLEMADQNEVFRARLAQVFRAWAQRLADCLEEARQAGEIAADSDVEQLAEFLLAGWEGASLRAKVTRSVKPMQDFITVFFNKVLK